MTRKRIRDLVLMNIMLIGYTAFIYSIGASARPEVEPLTLEVVGCEVDPQLGLPTNMQPL